MVNTSVHNPEEYIILTASSRELREQYLKIQNL